MRTQSLLPLLFAATAYPQAPVPVIIPTAPALSATLAVAEGEVLTAFLLVDDAAVFTTTEAPPGDLPYELQGIRGAITIPAILVDGRELSIPQPLLQVRPVRQCLSFPMTCTQVLAVTIQIDWRQTVAPDVYGYLAFTLGDRPTRRIELRPRLANPSILGRCAGRFDTIECLYRPAIFHQDGRPVQSIRPARAGEMLTLYLYGLGPTDPPVPPGRRAPATPLARVPRAITLAIDYRVNAAPRYQIERLAGSPGFESVRELTPSFLGLSPGSAGLYQINFLLAPPPAPTPPCPTPEDSNATLTVSSNDLPTLKLAFASVRFCIE